MSVDPGEPPWRAASTATCCTRSESSRCTKAPRIASSSSDRAGWRSAPRRWRPICAGLRPRARLLRARHMVHHAKFGTEHDQEFLNFVLRGGTSSRSCRWRPSSTSPTSSSIARPPTRRVGSSRRCSHGVQRPVLVPSVAAYGPLFALVTMFVFLPHVGFYLDRAAPVHRAQPDAARKQERVAQFRHRLLGAARRRRPLGIAVPQGASPGAEPAVVSAVQPAPIRRADTHAHQREQFLIVPVVGFPTPVVASDPGAESARLSATGADPPPSSTDCSSSGSGRPRAALRSTEVFGRLPDDPLGISRRACPWSRARTVRW